MMEWSVPPPWEEFEAVLAAEQPRLRGLCRKLTNDPEATDDLVQETLVEAWRNHHRLRDPAAISHWLSGIARNVCLRWMRSRYRLRIVDVGLVSSSIADTDVSHWPDEGIDLNLNLELEREELAALLDRALALLPPETREVLIERYVAERSYVEIASLLGTSEGSVAVRLHRGKLALRRALSTDLRDDAAALGLLDADHPTWRETRIWCSICGERRLVGRFDREQGDLILRCPVCQPRLGIHAMQAYGEQTLLSGVTGFKAAQRRVITAASAYYQPLLTQDEAACSRCGHAAQVVRKLPPEVPPRSVDRHGLSVRCHTCGHTTWMSLSGLALSLPEARVFVSTHERVRTLPERDINADGRDAVAIAFEAVKSQARLAVIVDRESLQPLSVEIEGGDGGNEKRSTTG